MVTRYDVKIYKKPYCVRFVATVILVITSRVCFLGGIQDLIMDCPWSKIKWQTEIACAGQYVM